MALDRLYGEKPQAYFANARLDIVDRLRTGPLSAVLELGCGAGGTGAAAIAAGKAGQYTGIELEPRAAAEARNRITEVVEGNVEAIDLTPWHGRFDALIISEVLEHLTDPWRVTKALALCLKPGAQLFASSPNVAHWRLITSLARGRFDYEESGIMDRTHLRWFTPASYRAMFEEAGFRVDSVEPLVPNAARTRLINRLTRGRLAHLFMSQMMLSGTKAD